ALACGDPPRPLFARERLLPHAVNAPRVELLDGATVRAGDDEHDRRVRILLNRVEPGEAVEYRPEEIQQHDTTGMLAQQIERLWAVDRGIDAERFEAQRGVQ